MDKKTLNGGKQCDCDKMQAVLAAAIGAFWATTDALLWSEWLTDALFGALVGGVVYLLTKTLRKLSQFISSAAAKRDGGGGADDSTS